MSLIERLRIANTSEVDGQVPSRSSSSLQDSIQLLDQSAKITSSQAQQARARVGIAERYRGCHRSRVGSRVVYHEVLRLWVATELA